MNKDKDAKIKNSPPLARGLLLAAVFLLGAAVLVLEIVGARLIGPYYGSSVYVWSALITVTLASLAVGYWIGGVWADRHPDAAHYFGQTVAGGALVLIIPFLKNPVLSGLSGLGIAAGSLASAAALFAPALVVLSATGPLAIRLVTAEFSVMGRGVGQVYAVSTFGSVAGALLTGFVLVPHFPARTVLFGLGAGLLLLGGTGFLLVGRGTAGAAATLAALFTAGALLVPRPAEATNVLLNQASFYGQIQVVDNGGQRFLLIDGVTHGSVDRATGEPGGEYFHCMEMPVLLRPGAKRALVIGLGAGNMPEQFSRHHGVATDAVEIDPVVARAARTHFGHAPSGRVAVEDGRTFLERGGETYGVIVLDAFASESVPFHLFTREFFQSARAHLEPGGVLAVNTVAAPGSSTWFPVYKTLKAVFPQVRAFHTSLNPDGLGNLVYFASEGSLAVEDVDLSKVRPAARGALETLRGNALAAPAPDALERAPLLTDDFNPIEHLYRGTVTAWRRSVLRTTQAVLLYDRDVR